MSAAAERILEAFRRHYVVQVGCSHGIHRSCAAARKAVEILVNGGHTVHVINVRMLVETYASAGGINVKPDFETV